MPYVDYKGYSRQPDGHTIIERLEINFDTVTVPQPGDVGVFFIRHRNLPQHAGIFTPRGMVHTYADLGKVVEQGIEDFWGKRLHTVFRFKGVEESYVQAESPTLEVTEWLEAHEKLTPKNSNRKPGTGRCENCGEH